MQAVRSQATTQGGAVMAATTGLPAFRADGSDAGTSALLGQRLRVGGVAWLSNVRSPPAKKVFFPDVMTTPLMSSLFREQALHGFGETRLERHVHGVGAWSGSSIVKVTIRRRPCPNVMFVISSDPFNNWPDPCRHRCTT